MNIRIEGLRGGEIELSPLLPSSLQQLRIPDSICYGAVGPFGHVLVQQLEGGGITLLYHTLYFTDGNEIIYSSDEPAIRLQIVLNNSYYYHSKHLGHGVLHERGISLNYVPYIHASVHLKPRETYSHLSVFYGIQHFSSLQSSIPGLISFLAKAAAGQPACFEKKYITADAAILSLVDNILDCPYHGHLRELYIELFCTELLLLSLVRISTDPGAAYGVVSEEDAVHVYKAKALILQGMGNSLSLSSLATEMNMGVYKLNHLFKSIYGVGVAEFLLEARMKKAHAALADTEASIAAIAKASGYSHPHAFSLAFKKYFGYTPAFVQKSGKSHDHQL